MSLKQISPFFQKFFQKYSYFAQLFPMPDTYGTPQALAGLQTRSNIQSILVQRLGSAGASFNPQSYIQGQVDGAALQLKDLKEKLYKFGGGSGSSDMTMPDFKKINSQRTKSFFQRLEFGFNIQNQRKTMFLPAISDLGLSLGYKISDYKTAGLGLAYKMGWGSGWNNIHFTSEGISIRGFADIKAKGNLWLSGGFEYNYMQRFNNFSQIKNLDDWQSSALIGLTKKQNIGKKEGKMQLLYDFLATKQIPQTQPLKFRIGYNF